MPYSPGNAPRLPDPARDPETMTPDPDSTGPVAIVGAGVTGLAAAFRLGQLGIDAVVYEASTRAGGPVHSVCRDGYLAEDGPNTLLETSPRIRALIRDIGLADQCLGADSRASKRFIVRNGVPKPIPGSIAGWLSTDLFSLHAKLRVLGDLFLPRQPTDAPEESVAGFVRRRLGGEFLDYAINPLVAGIYAGEPERLSVAQAFPRLAAVERRHRSLFLGQLLGARERRRSGETPRANAPKLSFVGGLGTLVSGLLRAVGNRVEYESSVAALARHVDGWEVESRRGHQVHRRRHRAVLLAAPAHKLARISLEGREGNSLAWLAGIVHAPVTSLVLGFRRGDVAHPLDGFGLLVPALEPFPILGAIFNSSLFPGRAPEGHVTITCYLGGSRDPGLALAPQDHQLGRVRESLARLIGARGEPTFVHRCVHAQGIPQYNLGYGEFRERMRRLEESEPGLRFAGHFRDGISLSDCLVAGLRVAEEIAGSNPKAPAPAPRANP